MDFVEKHPYIWGISKYMTYIWGIAHVSGYFRIHT